MNFGSIEDLIDIEFIIGEISSTNRIISYEVIGLTSTTITVKLDFEFPDEVSREDLLSVKLALNELETAFQDNEAPLTVELEIIDTNSTSLALAKVGTRATQAAVVTTTFLQILFVGSLA